MSQTMRLAARRNVTVPFGVRSVVVPPWAKPAVSAPAKPTKRVLLAWGARNTDGFAIGMPGGRVDKPAELDWRQLVRDLASGRKELGDYAAAADELSLDRLATGHSHSLIAVSHVDLAPVLIAMGLDSRGQLGLGSSLDGFRSGLVRVGQTGDKIVSLAAGRLHSAMVLARGEETSTWAWGENALGQLGLGMVGGQRHSPVKVPEPKIPTDGYSEYPFPESNWGKAAQVACGLDHTAVIYTRPIPGNRKEGYVCTAGWATDGQLGRPLAQGASEDPVLAAIPSLPPFASKLASRGDHTLALLGSTGTLWAWGNHEYSQCLYGPGVGEQHPIPVPAGGFGKFQGRIKGRGHAVGVAASGKASLVLSVGEVGTEGGWLRAAREVWVAGAGAIGLGEEIARPGCGPRKIRGPWEQGDEVTGVFAGLDSHYVATETSLYAFGGNRNGELGLGIEGSVLSPEKVELHVNGKVTDIEAGGDHALAIVEVDL